MRLRILTMMIFAAHGAMAQDLSVGVSTLGLTLEPSLRLGDRWAIRAPFGAGSLSFDDESNGQSYSGDLDMQGIGVMGDWYPSSSSGFRVSAGVFYTDYSADLQSDDVQFAGGITSNVTARVRQREHLMPVLAVGYGGQIAHNTDLSVTAGGMFGNGFDVNGRESSGLVSQSDIDAELRDIHEDLNDLDVVPYLQVSVGFRF